MRDAISRRKHLLDNLPLIYENVYSKSPKVIINVAYALTVTVKDAITKKPIQGAALLINTYSATTDETGKAVFPTIPPGTYTLRITHPSYLPKTITITLTEAGEAREVTLWPYWIIPAGMGAAFAAIVIGAKLAGYW